MTIIALLLILGIPTMLKLKEEQDKNIELVITNKIKDSANRCWNTDNCINNKVYIKELYNMGFLKQIVNPKTKEYISEESYAIKENNEVKVTIIY